MTKQELKPEPPGVTMMVSVRLAPGSDEISGLRDRADIARRSRSRDVLRYTYFLAYRAPRNADWETVSELLNNIREVRALHSAIETVDLVVGFHVDDEDLEVQLPSNLFDYRDVVDEIWIDAEFMEEITNGPADEVVVTYVSTRGRVSTVERTANAERRQQSFARMLRVALRDRIAPLIDIELRPYWGKAGIIITNELMAAFAQTETSLRLEVKAAGSGG